MGQMLFNMGLNTSEDRSLLAPGELQTAIGGFYKPGDTKGLWKILGRDDYGDAYAGAHAGMTVALFKYDTAANDKIVVYNDEGELHVSTVDTTTATTGTFTTLTTGLTTGTNVITWAHFDDVWYLSNKVNRPLAYESDGTLRFAGMRKPLEQLTAVGGTGAYTGRPTASSGGTGWSNIANAYDADADTYAHAAITDGDALDDSYTVTYTTIAADTSASRYITIVWELDMAVDGFPPKLAWLGFEQMRVRVKLEVSENAGSSWTTIMDALRSTDSGKTSISRATSVDSDQIQVRATITQKSTNAFNVAAFRIYDVKVTNVGTQGNFSTDTGIYYAITEFDENRGLESNYQVSELVSFSDQSIATITLPSAAQSATATHYAIYRTVDGGTVPEDLYFLAYVEVGQSNWLDTFEVDKDTVPSLSQPPFLKLQTTDLNAQYFDRNTPPPGWTAIAEYQNFMVCIDGEFPRQLRYSLPGFPEYWPTIYSVTDFPLKEHDKLQALAVAGDLLVVGAEEAIIIINGLPELSAQSLVRASMTPLRNAPGCVGPHAMEEYSIHGEPRVAWVSKFGVYETNGHTLRDLTPHIDWESAVNVKTLERSYLFWNRKDQCLHVGVDTGGDSKCDRFFTLFMGDSGRRPDGLPKVTGPHYGNVTNVVGGVTSNGEYRLYSLNHNTSGEVYNELNGTTDQSEAYSGTIVPWDIKGARLYSQDLTDSAVDFPLIRHMDWGAGAGPTNVRIEWSFGRDDIGESATVTNTLTMDTQKRQKFVIARSGEWHEVRFVHEGESSTGGILMVEADVLPMGGVGDTQDS